MHFQKVYILYRGKHIFSNINVALFCGILEMFEKSQFAIYSYIFRKYILLDNVNNT